MLAQQQQRFRFRGCIPVSFALNSWCPSPIPRDWIPTSTAAGNIWIWSKEVYKSNFRQYGQMKSKDWKSHWREEKKEDDLGARKGRKFAKHCFFQMICGSGGSKSRLAKAAGAEPAGQMRNEKLHAVVAQSTFRSQKCKNLTGSEPFWKLRYRNNARNCGAKHIAKSKVWKTDGFRPLLEVEMSKKCTPLWHGSTFASEQAKNISRSDHF